MTILTVLCLMLLGGAFSLEAQTRSERSDRPVRSNERINQGGSRMNHYDRQPRQVYSRPAPRVRYAPRYYGGYRNYGYGIGGYYGGYGYRGYPTFATGIKFNLDLVPKKDRHLVSKGIVTIDGSEFGIVDRNDGWQNGPISLSPGNHQVIVELEDSRIFETEVSIGLGEVRHVYLRFGPTTETKPKK